jgi:hypothetical protein
MIHGSQIKMYEHIQDGVAQGFSFSAVKKAPKQDYYIQIIETIQSIIVFVLTYALLHVIFFVLL